MLREDVADYFELDADSPYMLLVASVKNERAVAMTSEQKQALFGIDKLNVPRSDIPAVTHVDYSARIQTVHAETNPRYHALLQALQGTDRLPGARQHQLQRARRTDRLHARRMPFAASWAREMDVLVVGNCFLRKEDQLPAPPSVVSRRRRPLSSGRLLACLSRPGRATTLSGTDRRRLPLPSSGATLCLTVDGIRLCWTASTKTTATE